MTYQGTIKSLGKEFGFVTNPDLLQKYNRDTFINRSLIGEEHYMSLSCGETIQFDVFENPRGEPVATMINGIPPVKGKGSKGKGVEAQYGMGMEGKGKPFQPPMPAGDMYGEQAGMYEEYQPMMDPWKGKGKGPPSAPPPQAPQAAPSGDRPPFLPSDAQQVTLFEKLGWFVSQESCTRFMEGMKAAQAMGGGGSVAMSSYDAGPQQMKRAADPYGGKGDYGGYGASYGYDGGKGDYSWGKPSGKGKDASGGKPAMKQPRMEVEAGPTENPGLIEGDFIYTGIVKNPPDPVTGYGFIECEEIGSKDAFLHIQRCPWVKTMNLQAGEAVLFNVAEQPKDEPQVKRIIRVPA